MPDFTSEYLAMRAENDRLKRYLHRAFVLLSAFGGEGLSITDQEEPFDLLFAYMTEVGLEEMDIRDSIATLEPAF